MQVNRPLNTDFKPKDKLWMFQLVNLTALVAMDQPLIQRKIFFTTTSPKKNNFRILCNMLLFQQRQLLGGRREDTFSGELLNETLDSKHGAEAGNNELKNQQISRMASNNLKSFFKCQLHTFPFTLGLAFQLQYCIFHSYKQPIF